LEGSAMNDGFLHRSLNQMVNLAIADQSFCETQQSKTVARVYSMGDDGYGYGCVGRLAA
jgi:hypothetical protein